MDLVTGAAGHLGNVLIRNLLARGTDVRALVLPGEALDSLQGMKIDIVEGNILNKDDLRKAMKGIDVVYHMAAFVAITLDKVDLMQEINVEGTRNVIEIAKEMGVRRLVYTSSIHALERPPMGTCICEDMAFDTVNPAGPYDRTKAQASVLVRQAAADGLDTVIVMPTGVIGPYDFNRSEMGEMILSWMEKKPSMTTDGRFDFVDVRDVAMGHILAAEKGRNGEIYLLSGECVDVPDLRAMVQEAAGIKTPRMHFPAWFALLVAPLAEQYYRITKTRPKLTRYSVETLLSNSQISSSKARAELGFTTRPLKESVLDTVRWWQINKRKIKPSLRLQTSGQTQQ